MKLWTLTWIHHRLQFVGGSLTPPRFRLRRCTFVFSASICRCAEDHLKYLRSTSRTSTQQFPWWRNMDMAPLTCFQDGAPEPSSGRRNRNRTRSSNFHLQPFPPDKLISDWLILVLLPFAAFMQICGESPPSTPRCPPVGLSLCITSTPKSTKVKLSCSARGWWIMNWSFSRGSAAKHRQG